MAGPFNIDTTTPGDTDLQSAYPFAERTFRTVVNDWLTFMSDPATGLIKAQALPSPVPLETYYTAGGTHTFATTTTFFQIEAVGGGAGGGGIDGQGASTLGAAGGGAGGFWGKTLILEKGAITDGTVVVGAAGAGGTGSPLAHGTAGGDTTWADGTNSFTWGGGQPAPSAGGDDDGYIGMGGVAATHVGTIYGYSEAGGKANGGSGPGHTDPFSYASSGSGGNSQLGTGGRLVGSSGSGNVGTGYGAGGGGGMAVNITTNVNGGAGTPGLLIVREW